MEENKTGFVFDENALHETEKGADLSSDNRIFNNHVMRPEFSAPRKYYLEKFDLEKIIEYIRTFSARQGEYLMLEKYFKGYHYIRDRYYTDLSKPNNRLSHNFPKVIVNTATSYFTGNPPQLKSTDVPTVDAVQEVYNYNDAHDITSELDRLSNLYGHAFEVHWREKEDGKTLHRFKYISPKNAMMFYSPEIDEKPVAFVSWIIEEDEITKEKIYKIRIYDETYFYDVDFSLKDNTTNKPVVTKSDPHLFKGVPAVEFLNNEERRSSFEDVIDLIDAYNKVVSDTINDVEYWADSYLMLKEMSGTSPSDIAKMRRNRVLLVDGNGGDASFLNKQTNDKHIENIKDRLTQDIHKFSQVPNLHDEQFATNLSGSAIKWKMKDLEDKTSNKERKFQKSFRLRHKLILSTLGLLEKANDAAEIQVVMTRNIPANIIELAELAAKIPPGLFSNETLREQFPFAYNEEIEKKRIEAEKEKQLESEMGANPFANPPNTGDKPPEGGNPTEPPKNEPPKE